MIKELCSVLKSRLVGYNFVDLLAGLALTVTESSTTNNEAETGITTITNRYPVSYDTNQDAAVFGPEIDLIPNSERKTIIYFEDFGTGPANKNIGREQFYNSQIRLICWMNTANFPTVMPSGEIMATIIKRLTTGNPINSGYFLRLTATVARIPPKDAGLFGRYTYNEAQRQYLRPPYDFFGIDFNVNYLISSHCLQSPIQQTTGNTLPFTLA